jgi:hypothetical protein
MTAREQLHHLVDKLGDDQAEGLLRLATYRYALPVQRSRSLPAFVAMGDSGRSDVSERVREILDEGFGR